jgi:hypothetical protein
MRPGQLVILGTLLFAVYCGWSLSRGRPPGVTLYALAVAVLVSLVGAAAAQLVGAAAVIEPLNVVAIALSLAALPASPSMWEEEVDRALRTTRLYQAVRPSDLLSWKAWLKLVDRIGARRAGLAYLGVFAAAIVGALVAPRLGPSTEQAAFAVVTVVSPGLFALLSAGWIYRSARRLVPGA